LPGRIFDADAIDGLNQTIDPGGMRLRAHE
jgi:hypothetical protein